MRCSSATRSDFSERSIPVTAAPRPGRWRRWLGGCRGARFHAAVGLQAGDQLLVLVALGTQLRALVAGDGLALALALDLQAARIDALLRQVVGDGLGALLGELLVVILGADAVGVAGEHHLFDVRALCVLRQVIEPLLAAGKQLGL